MSYYDVVDKYRNFDWESAFGHTSTQDVARATREEGSRKAFLSLLSPKAEAHLEEMASASREKTMKHFGRTMQIYAPLYISNYCDNRCLYCGFNSNNNIERRKLSLAEVEKEAQFLASTGIRHILVLTGESRSVSPIDYIKNCVRVLKKHFSSITIEIYPLTEYEYRLLISEGVDGLTIYQEVYDESIYRGLHPAGPKSDYRFRLDAAERGARAGMHNVNIGSLLGLNDWRREIFLAGLHAKYIQDLFPAVEIGVGLPRMRPHAGNFKTPYAVSDKNLVQMILALRLFLPRLAITISTRERPEFRENIVPLGITRMSAGSSTRVGGYTLSTGPEAAAQFEIADLRNVEEIKAMLRRKGYQGVLKDWM